MLIKKLNKLNKTSDKISAVAAARIAVRKTIANTNDADALMRVAVRTYADSRKHPLTRPLQREAELATQKAVALRNEPEHVAASVMLDGAAFFRANNKRISSRLFAMKNRYGNWTAVHARLVSNNAGGDNFKWLKANNKLELTSEWFVARHARNLVSANVAAELDSLLAA